MTDPARRYLGLALALLPVAGCAIDARIAVAPLDGGRVADSSIVVITDAGSSPDTPVVDPPRMDVPMADGATSRFVTSVAPGTCASLNDGSLWCWGPNGYAQVGDGTMTPSLAPSRNLYLTGVSSVFMSIAHACAIVSSGDVWCWGANGAGESGAPAGTSVFAPRPVAGISNAVQLASARGFTCAVVRDGSLWCWGSNVDGQLGTPRSLTATHVPQRVPGMSGVVQVAALLATTCARFADGTLMCWGNNQRGSIGDGTTSQFSSPVRVAGIGDALDVGTGEFHSCALRSDHTVWCWGSDMAQAIGPGPAHLTPRAVPGVSGARQLGVSQLFTCARLMDGTAVCWGNPSAGGNTSAGNYGPNPVAIAGTRGSIDLRVSERAACVRFADGRIACWGANSGELGDGTTAPRLRAEVVAFP